MESDARTPLTPELYMKLLKKYEALTAKLAAVERERDEWRSGSMADMTGHLHRCAKMNGTWNCFKGCAIPQLAEAQARIRELEQALRLHLAVAADDPILLQHDRKEPS